MTHPTHTETRESQTAICRRLLKSGKKLTPLVMLNKYGIYRLAARIQNLRDDGMKINTELINEYPVKFARYSI